MHTHGRRTQTGHRTEPRPGAGDPGGAGAAAGGFSDPDPGRYREDYLRQAAALLAGQAEQTNRYLAYRELRHQAEALKQTYPDFDLNRELEDPTFARLIRNQVDPATAYEVVHRRELAEAAARRERILRHPVENGLDRAAAPALLQTDPRALTASERRQLRRRAARGEEIVW